MLRFPKKKGKLPEEMRLILSSDFSLATFNVNRQRSTVFTVKREWSLLSHYSMPSSRVWVGELPWWSSGKVCLPMQGTQVPSRFGKIVYAVRQLSLCPTAREATMRSPSIATGSRPHSLQLEKAHLQQWRPIQTKKNSVGRMKTK